MTEPPEPEIPFGDALESLAGVLQDFDNRGLVIGGVAVSLLAAPRLTADVDAMLLLDVTEIPRLIESAAAHGLTARIEDAAAFAAQSRVLLLRHAASGIGVDIALGMLPFEEEAVARGRLHETGRVAVPLPTPEDLIILKAVAHRPKDLLDIESILRAHPDVDRRRIENGSAKARTLWNRRSYGRT